jgi:hypothetical protein
VVLGLALTLSCHGVALVFVRGAAQEVTLHPEPYGPKDGRRIPGPYSLSGGQCTPRPRGLLVVVTLLCAGRTCSVRVSH